MSTLHSPQLAQEQAEYRASIVEALKEDDDPLAAYDDFIKWTNRTFSPADPNSGLIQLLEEATRKFKDDARYSGDRRYLKLWCSYAKAVETPSTVYAYVVKKGIGCVFAQLWEEYATSLEQEGRRTEADKVFRVGISRSALPIERLKKRYREFKTRPPPSKSQHSPMRPSGVDEVDVLRRNPFKNYGDQATSTPETSQSAQACTSVSSGSSSVPSAHARYAPMLAPPAPGRRPEKLRFNLSLLFTPSGVEYSAAEVRARSMGLYGKKWGPPVPSELHDSSSGAARVNFNDDGSRSTQNMGATASNSRRKSTIATATGEPTVTINTKEALADVFGMYNSPDKTVKRTMPGTKHAPVRKIEPMGGRKGESSGPRKVELANSVSNENEIAKASVYKSHTDEISSQKGNSAQPKFKPFVDDVKQLTAAPTPNQGRRALSLKEASTPSESVSTPYFAASLKPSPPDAVKPTFLKPAPEEMENKPVFSKPNVRMPQGDPPIRPSCTTSTVKASECRSILQEQAQAQQSFVPFTHSKTPFRVFSRPPSQGQGENGGLGDFAGSVFMPKPPAIKDLGVGAAVGTGTFKPFVDNENAPRQSQARASAKKINALQPRVVPPTVVAVHTEDPSPREGPGEEYREPEPDMDAHALSSNSSLANLSESDEGYPFEYGEGVEAGVASSSDSQFDEESEQLPYSVEYGQEGAFREEDIDGEDEGGEYREPLGRRFGRINIMTPITERTFEFSTRGLPTPTNTTFLRDKQWREREGRESGKYALEVAESLARELQEEYEEDQDNHHDLEGSHPNLSIPLSQVAASIQGGYGVTDERTGTLSPSDPFASISTFRPPNPCNPFDPEILSMLLSFLPAESDFHDRRAKDGGMLDSLQRFAATKARNSKGAALDDGILLIFEDLKFRVTEKLGEGGFGAVFLAQALSKSEEAIDFDEDEDEGEAKMHALKVVKPRNLWEFHVLRRVHSVLQLPLTRSIILPLALYAFADESYLLLELCPHGTLLDVVNRAGPIGVSQQGACLDELLVFFFTVELLRFVEGMHNAGFIHGDLKIDNCLLRIEELPRGIPSLSGTYQPCGEGGWEYRGIKVIDFGRTIDMSLFPAGHGQQFIADWPIDERDCPEIRQGRPWTFQTDYFGLAGIVYCMLFGKYIEASSVMLAQGSTEADPIYKIATPFKRYWQATTLDRLFHLLLNPCRVHSDGNLPVCKELAEVRLEMEEWLQHNCNRSSNTLKGLLKKIELSTYTR